MIISALVAALHYLALGVGLGSVFMRGRYLRSRDAARVLAADNLWGLSAVLWIVTGLARAFGGLEKGTEFYLHSHLFLLKMVLFGAVFVLEVWPMTTLIRWRIVLSRNGSLPPATTQMWARLRLINDVETVLVLVIPVVASFMARGF